MSANKNSNKEVKFYPKQAQEVLFRLLSLGKSVVPMVTLIKIVATVLENGDGKLIKRFIKRFMMLSKDELGFISTTGNIIVKRPALPHGKLKRREHKRSKETAKEENG